MGGHDASGEFRLSQPREIIVLALQQTDAMGQAELDDPEKRRPVFGKRSCL